MAQRVRTGRVLEGFPPIYNFHIANVSINDNDAEKRRKMGYSHPRVQLEGQKSCSSQDFTNYQNRFLTGLEGRKLRRHFSLM